MKTEKEGMTVRQESKGESKGKKVQGNVKRKRQAEHAIRKGNERRERQKRMKEYKRMGEDKRRDGTRT